MSESTKTSNSTTTKTTSRVKPLSASEIRRITGQKQSGFPTWAVENYGKTHNLRWISQRNMYNDQDQVDKRGYEILRDPSTGKIARKAELMLGAMPKEIAKERAEEIKEQRQAQQDFVKDKIEGLKDRLQYEANKAGYTTPSTNFNYSNK